MVRPWRPLAPCDAITFAADIERLARFYKAQGFYRAEIDRDLQVALDSQTVKSALAIREGEPITVAQITLTFVDHG